MTIGGKSGIHEVPVISDNVLFGTVASILEPVTLGDDCIVAAGAVVTKDVAPRTIVAGVPAKYIKDVSEE